MTLSSGSRLVHTGIEGFDMPAPDDVRRAADGLRMLADLAGTLPTAVSQHLSKLRLAGLVTNRREGTFIYYALADHHIGELVRQALSHADHHPGRVSAPTAVVMGTE